MLADARVRYFRMEAEAARWREQLQMLGAEFGRTIRYFRKLADMWTELGSRDSVRHSNATLSKVTVAANMGRRAYALKRAAWLSALSTDVERKLKDCAQKCGTTQDWAEFDWGACQRRWHVIMLTFGQTSGAPAKPRKQSASRFRRRRSWEGELVNSG